MQKGYDLLNIFKFMSPELIFGPEALGQVGESLLRLGVTRVFVVSDIGVLNAGWIDRVLEHLEEAKLSYVVWTNLTPNPKDYEVAAGVNEYLANQCDAVLAVGGGSPIDTGKAIALVATNGGKINDYEGIDKVTRPLPPIVAVPTTAGTGAEVSQFSIIVDSSTKVKMTIISKSLIPDIAIIDPLILTTKDKMLTANTGMDALSHAVEAYVSLAATPLTDIHALSAIELIGKNLRNSVACNSNIEAKRHMAMASLKAGLAFSNAILGAVHAMAHPLGGDLDLPHGEANAILLPYVMEYNLPACLNRYSNIAVSLGANINGLSSRSAALKAIQEVRQLSTDIGIPEKLSNMGLKRDIIPYLSECAVKDACLITNPRKACVEDIANIYSKAF